MKPGCNGQSHPKAHYTVNLKAANWDGSFTRVLVAELKFLKHELYHLELGRVKPKTVSLASSKKIFYTDQNVFQIERLYEQ